MALNDWQRQLLGLPPETAYAMPDPLAYAQPDQQPMALPQQAPAPVAPPSPPPLDMKTADTGQMVTSPFAGIGQALQPIGQAVGVVPQPGVTEQPDQYGVLPTERRQAFFDGLARVGAAMLGASGKMSSADRMAMLAQGLGGFGETARTSALNAAQQRLATTETKDKQAEKAKRDAAIASLMNNPNVPDAVKQALQIDPETVSKALAANALSAQSPTLTDKGKQVAELERGGMAHDDAVKTVFGLAKPGRDVAADETAKRQALFAARSSEADQLGLGPEEKRGYILTGKLQQPEKMTSDQAKSAGFATRVADSDKILSQPAISAAGMSRWERTKESIPWFGHGQTSPEFQMADQAQRDFVNAVLRRESGAAISQSEFDNARKQYFPQPGDGPEVLAQKAKNRQNALQGLLAATSPEFRKGFGQPAQPAAPAAAAPTGGAQAAPAAPQVGFTKGGYRFKGGNPADPHSWEKL